MVVFRVTFDYELTLIKVTSTENAMGDFIEQEEPLNVLCDVESVTRSEHYAASSNGIKPEIVFILNQYEYDKQRLVEFEGTRYKVIREYKSKQPKYFDTIELVCEGVTNNGDA